MGILLLFNDFWQFIMIYPFYGINPAQAENPFLFLYLFQDFNVVIMSYKFTGVIILEGEDLAAKEVNEWRPEDQRGGPMRLQY